MPIRGLCVPRGIFGLWRDLWRQSIEGFPFQPLNDRRPRTNAGLAVEVKAHTQGKGSSRLSLFRPMPDPIGIGDAFTVTAGCDKALTTCRDRSSNVVNFGGFPHMPGNDFALSYPTKGDDNDGSALT